MRASQASRDRDYRVGLRHLEPAYDTAAERAETIDSAERVRQGMGDLTALQRQAIELVYLSELSYSEVAGLLQVPVATVRTRLRDGLVRLRSNFAPTF